MRWRSELTWGVVPARFRRCSGLGAGPRAREESWGYGEAVAGSCRGGGAVWWRFHGGAELQHGGARRGGARVQRQRRCGGWGSWGSRGGLKEASRGSRRAGQEGKAAGIMAGDRGRFLLCGRGTQKEDGEANEWARAISERGDGCAGERPERGAPIGGIHRSEGARATRAERNRAAGEREVWAGRGNRPGTGLPERAAQEKD